MALSFLSYSMQNSVLIKEPLQQDLLSCFVSVFRYKVDFRHKVTVEVSVMKGRRHQALLGAGK